MAMYFPKRDELSLRTVRAFPNASSSGFVDRTRSSISTKPGAAPAATLRGLVVDSAAAVAAVVESSASAPCLRALSARLRGLKLVDSLVEARLVSSLACAAVMRACLRQTHASNSIQVHAGQKLRCVGTTDAGN